MQPESTTPRAVVITGVSTGIGWGATKTLISQGWHVFGSVRKAADAERLTTEFGDRFTPLFFDVTDEAAVQRAAQQVSEQLGGRTLAGLVNNAGIAVPGPLLHLPVAEFRWQLEVNLVGVLTVTQAFLPLLGVDLIRQGEPGRIVNISSVAGKQGSPFLGAYAASKHGLEGLSESLRRELMLYGIDVIVIGPGAVATPIWDKAEQLDPGLYAQTDYAAALRGVRDYMIGMGRKGLPPEQIGAVIHTALTAPRPRVRYAVTPEPWFTQWITRLLPKRQMDRLIAQRLQLTPLGRDKR